jgi:NHLM bacteriocin system ABC transporter ATP-binding protein
MVEQGYMELSDKSIAEITSVFGIKPQLPADASANSAFLSACRCVAEAAKLEIRRIPPLKTDASDVDHLQQIAIASAFRCRRVDLTGDWWRDDHGPLLVFRRQDHAACALVPRRRGRYYLVESTAGGEETRTPLDAKSASELESTAYMFYRPLPERVLGWRDLLEFGLAGLGRDVRWMLFAMATASILGLLVPIATGMIFDYVVPAANISLLNQLILALTVSVVAVTLFDTTEKIASMRLELKMNASLQAALWDRLLRLPVSFFRRYSVGDLADRADGIDEIQQTITSNVITTAIGSVFSVFTLLLMIYYHAGLALVAVALTLVFAAVSVFTSLAQLKYQRDMYATRGRLSGFLLQILTNISKLRVSNKEEIVFQRWLSPFVRITRLFIKAETINIRLVVFSSIFSLLATAILFLMVVTLGKDLSFGQFIAFNAAFGQFFAAVLAVSQVVADSLQIVPLYERSRPILSALPEDTNRGVDCGDIKGGISIEQLHFRYPQNAGALDQTLSPWVFKGLNLTVEPGEFIALVGPSGSGKSSLFRLLLGFEQPTSGKVFYDGHNLATLNVEGLRRQCGVVLQGSSLLPGTIWDNIAFGGNGISEEQAWAAARYAEIDKDILAMPMGMYTQIAEGGKNISAGQRQRILIARALAKKPKILFFDEATSALDNMTQARIARHIEGLGISCVVAAHRLSTVVRADRIFVFDRGDLAQQGTYAELVAQPGLFAEIAQRQTV